MKKKKKKTITEQTSDELELSDQFGWRYRCS